MASLRDGLGGEEVQISGLQAGGTNISPYWTGSITTESQISGLNVYANGSLVANRINDANGNILSNSTGSPASYGIKIQVGTVATSAGSEGTIEFGTQFTNGNYIVTLTAGSDNSGKAPYVSGARNVSGCEIVGEASTTYNYIAAGL